MCRGAAKALNSKKDSIATGHGGLAISNLMAHTALLLPTWQSDAQASINAVLFHPGADIVRKCDIAVQQPA